MKAPSRNIRAYPLERSIETSVRHDVAERRLALRRPVVWCLNDLYGAGEQFQRECVGDCLIADPQILVRLLRPEQTRSNEQQRCSSETRTRPAGEIRPPIHRNHGVPVSPDI